MSGIFIGKIFFISYTFICIKAQNKWKHWYETTELLFLFHIEHEQSHPSLQHKNRSQTCTTWGVKDSEPPNSTQRSSLLLHEKRISPALKLAAELTNKSGCRAGWSMSECVFKAVQEPNCDSHVVREGGKEGTGLRWEVAITFQTCHQWTMKKLDLSAAPPAGDVIHQMVHRGSALVWTLRRSHSHREKDSSLFRLICFLSAGMTQHMKTHS